MEEFKEFQGKSLDEAIKGACSYFNAPREKLEIDIVQDAKNGIFGLVGARKAVVRVRRAQLKSKVGAILGREASSVPVTPASPTAPVIPAVPVTPAAPVSKSKSSAAPRPASRPAPSAKSDAAKSDVATSDAAGVAPSDAAGQSRSARPTNPARPASPARPGRPERAEQDERRPQRPPRDFGQPSILPREERSQEILPFEDETLGNRIVPLPEVEDESIGNRILPPPEDEDESIGNRVDDRHVPYTRPGDERSYPRPFPGDRSRLRQERPKPAPRFAAPRPERPEGAPYGDPAPHRRAPRLEAAPFAVANREHGVEADGAFVEGVAATPFNELDHEKLALVAQHVASTMVNAILGETPVLVKILENRVDVRVECGDDSGLLIGREGQTLAALQYLASRIVSRTMDAPVRVQFDVGDYRERQDDRLRELALALAERARVTGRPCSTRPMSSYHRRLVHMALQDAPDMQTRSSGEGPLKRVIIQRRRQALQPQPEREE